MTGKSRNALNRIDDHVIVTALGKKMAVSIKATDVREVKGRRLGSKCDAIAAMLCANNVVGEDRTIRRPKAMEKDRCKTIKNKKLQTQSQNCGGWLTRRRTNMQKNEMAGKLTGERGAKHQKHNRSTLDGRDRLRKKKGVMPSKKS